MPFAFALFSFKQYDLVISVTSEFAKGVITTGKTKHICICLTPTRYLWSGYDEYFRNSWFRRVSFPLVWLLRKWDRALAKLPDTYVAISKEVGKRIKRYYKRDSVVVYPPVAKLPKAKKNSLFEREYFLVVSRLSKFTHYKRVDIAIKAATQLCASLIVVGAGDRRYVEKIAGPTVHFTGNVSDGLLAQYYKNAKALLFPGNEDFGIVMVEALSFGTPVIAYGKGGAREIVKSGKTGTFFASQTVPSLVKALKSFQATRYNRIACEKQAKLFSEKRFQKAIRRIVKEVTSL